MAATEKDTVRVRRHAQLATLKESLPGLGIVETAQLSCATAASPSLTNTFSIETVGVSPTPPDRGMTGLWQTLLSLKAPRGPSMWTIAPSSTVSWSQQETIPLGTAGFKLVSLLTVIRYTPSSLGAEDTV
jgi:hypothetical protein